MKQNNIFNLSLPEAKCLDSFTIDDICIINLAIDLTSIDSDILQISVKNLKK